MLNPCKVTHCQSNLAVDSPDDATEHSCTHSSHIRSLAIRSEGLIKEDDNVEEEDNERAIDTVAHPPQYSVPIEEQISGSLLIQCRELQNQEVINLVAGLSSEYMVLILTRALLEVLTCKQTSEETSCSNTPSEMTGNEVRMTLNDSIYQSSYIDCPEKPVNASK